MEMSEVGQIIFDSLAPDEAAKFLREAASKGDLDQVTKLLDVGASVNGASPHNGMSALHYAVAGDRLDVAKLLVTRGAAFFPDRDGRWPSAIAADCDVSEEMCDFIVEAEAKAIGMVV